MAVEVPAVERLHDFRFSVTVPHLVFFLRWSSSEGTGREPKVLSCGVFLALVLVRPDVLQG
jgi:hypothetical protein